MKFLKYVFMVTLLAFLNACATMELGEAQKKSMKNIGLVVLLNDHYSSSYIGVTVFNNTNRVIPHDTNEFVQEITATSKSYLESKGYEVTVLDRDKRFKAQYDGIMYNQLRHDISENTGAENVDTVFIFHDGDCFVVGPENKFGQRQSMRVAGHGRASRTGMPEQLYACLHLDIVTAKKYKHILEQTAQKNVTYTTLHSNKKPASIEGSGSSSSNRTSGGDKDYMADGIKAFFKELTTSILEAAKI